MKKFFSILALGVGLWALDSSSTPVRFNSVSLTGTVNNRQILVTPDVAQNPLVIGTNLVSTVPFMLQPVGGEVITNLLPWGYTIKVDGWPRSAHIVVPDDTATNNAAGLINTNLFAPISIYTGDVGTGVTNNQVLPGTPTTTNGNFAGIFSGTATNTLVIADPSNVATLELRGHPGTGGKTNYIQSTPGGLVLGTSYYSYQLSTLGEFSGVTAMPSLTNASSLLIPITQLRTNGIPDATGGKFLTVRSDGSIGVSNAPTTGNFTNSFVGAGGVTLTTNAAGVITATGATTNQLAATNYVTAAILARGYATVLDFGGVDSTTADNAPAFQRLFNYCSTNGAIAKIIPATNALGGWACYDTLYCSNSVTIEGGSGALHVSDDPANLSRCHFKFYTTNKHGIVIPNPTASVKIDRIFISCATANNWRSNTFGLYFAGGTPDSDCSVVSQVMVTNYGVGILGASCADTAFRNCSLGYNGDGLIVSNVANNITLDACQMSYNYRIQYWNGPGAITTIVSGDFAPQASLSGSNSLAILNSGQLNISGCNIENNSTNPCIINNGRLYLGDSVSMQNFLGNFPATYSVLMTNTTSTLFVSRNAALNAVSSTNSLPLFEINTGGRSGITGTALSMSYEFANGNSGFFNRMQAQVSPFMQESTSWSGSGTFAPGTVANTGISGVKFGVRRRVGGKNDDQFLVSAGLESFGGNGTDAYWIDLFGFYKEKVTTMSVAALAATGTISGNASGLTNIQKRIIQTNFVSGQVYNNSYGSAITVSAKTSLGVAAVSGAADVSLRCDASPANGGWTNSTSMTTLITSIAMNYTNFMSLEIPTNANFCFTNLSSGAGNTATVVGGQIRY